MRRGPGTERGRRATACTTVLMLVGALTTIITVLGPVGPAAAATVSIGTIQAQMADHRGVDSGITGNCITYAPVGTATSSALVSSPNEAQTAHGRSGSSCPSTLNTSTQSAVGFRPSAVSSANDGAQFLIGRMIHYNNPITTSDEFFTGKLNTVLGGFTSPNTLTFPWSLDETPNTGGGNCCDDIITFSNQISSVTLTQNGLQFKLVITGFVPVATGTTCPATASGKPVNQFKTVEGAQTHACLYASLQQLRNLTIVKTVTGSPPGTPSFNFTSTSALDGSPWSNGSWSLNAGGTYTKDLVSGDTVKVTETDPNDDRWLPTGLTCKQFAADGTTLVDVAGTTLNLAARQAVLTNVPAPLSVSNPGIICTYTNTYTPKSTLTLVKSVQSGTAASALWTLTATGSATPPPAGIIVSGPSGSAAVTTQRVPSGSYALTEIGTGAAGTGYAQVGDWACRTAGGATVPVSNGSVTLPDQAAANATGNVTCTATNRFVTGSLRVTKMISDPNGGFTGGTSKTFSGTYDCGAGVAGTFATLTTATPVTITNIPAGRQCTVTENPPAGGLANASYAWGTRSFTTQPVTITDGGTATVTITNPVVQNFGSFALTKTISGPGGYTGGTNRVFPVTYICTLSGGPTTAGTLNLTTAGSVSPGTPIPGGSVCTFTEALTTQVGDFSDPSYVWSGSVLNPTSVTIGVNTTAAVTLTNTYKREFGSLIIAKVVSGGGYNGGTAANFTVGYNCDTGFTGTVKVAAGASVTVANLPARITCSVQETTPSASLLDPAFVWGTPTWDPGPTATIPANGSATLTVTNPTIAVFGKVQITKALTGARQGVVAGATFRVTAACDNGSTYPFDVGVGETATTPDLAVGTSCTITESRPSVDDLLDSSFDWGPTPDPQTVTVTSSGQLVSVTVTNTVVRVRGDLRITKAPIVGGGVVDPDRTFDIKYRCVYGSDDPVTDTVSLKAGASATVPNLLLGSRCLITEDPATLTAPPDPNDASWIWLPPTYDPGQIVDITSANTAAAVSVTNTITQLRGSFNLTKVVTGEGKVGGYAGGQFDFNVACTGGQGTTDVALTDGQSTEFGPYPTGTSCTITETGKPGTPAAYGWDPVQFTVDGVQQGTSAIVTITSPDSLEQVTATNPITPRTSSVRVAKSVTGQTAGLVAGTTFPVTLDCGPGHFYQLDVPADGAVTQDGVPVGSDCTATETTQPAQGLVDDSYAWGPPVYSPADATVTVASGATATIRVENPVVRVTAPVQLVKTFSGAQGVVDADRTYPISWSCSYKGTTVAAGDQNIRVGPSGVTVATDVPVTSICTATEGDLGSPSDDPAYRWLAPVVTDTTIALPGPNTITVANALTRDSGTVRVQKQVTGATEGYKNLGTGEEDFTLHGSCSVPGHPEIPTRYADGTIADGGEKPIVASIGWTCSGYEDTPSQSLLKDASYAWSTPILDPAGTFTLTRDNPTRVFLAQNPIVRAYGSLTITKTVNDRNGVVSPTATFRGAYSCRYGNDAPVEGTWTITPGVDPTFTVGTVLLTSVCTVTEDIPSQADLPDASWSWGPAEIDTPATVVAGNTATINVTNAPLRLYAGLQVTKTLTDPKSGAKAGTTFVGVWKCTQGDVDYTGRFSVAAGASQMLFTQAERKVPATAVCTVTEDTLDPENLVDGSFAWEAPTYAPDAVTLVTGETADLGIRNTVIRVYSDVTVQKQVSGPGADLVDVGRAYTGTITCRYRTDPAVVASWSATTGTPFLLPGVLVGSTCSAVEDSPGAAGQPVTGDPSYVWGDPIIGDPVTVTAPELPTPPIVVQNPTGRLFGSFTVTKKVTGATEGIVDPTQPYTMTYSCQPGSGAPITGNLEVRVNATRTVGPGQEIPIDSACTVTEPEDGTLALVDAAWSWGEPTFTADVTPVEITDRSISFTIPTPQEDKPSPNVAVGVTNTVKRSSGSYTLAKSSNPPSGTTVKPGSRITYTLTASNNSQKSVLGATASDDLSKVLPYATLVTPLPTGLTQSGNELRWAIPTIPIAGSVKVSYSVTVKADAIGVTVTNVATPTDTDGVCASCTTTHRTPAAWTLKKVADPASGTSVNPGSTIRYTLTATNTGKSVVTGAEATDDLRKVLPFADLAAPLPAGLTRSSTTLSWAIPDIAVGKSVSVTFSVTVHDDAANVTIENQAAVAGTDGRCAACMTRNPVPAADALVASTGMPTREYLGWAVLLLLSGGLMLLAGRRRRPSAPGKH